MSLSIGRGAGTLRVAWARWPAGALTGLVRETGRSAGPGQGAEGSPAGARRDHPSGPVCVSLCLPAGHRFGGGPAVNHLYVCSICQVEIEALAKRRRVEIDTFIKVRAAGGGTAEPGFQPPPGTWGLQDKRAAWCQALFGGRVLWEISVATGPARRSRFC